MKMQLLFEGWREYLSEADYSQELADAHDDGDVDMFDEWMVWARPAIQRIIGILAERALTNRGAPGSVDLPAESPNLDSFPGVLYNPSEEIKEALHDELLFGKSKLPESLHSKMHAAWLDAPPDSANEAAMNVLGSIEEQIIKEIADFGKALEKIWDDPEGAQFKEKLVKRTIEDWRAAKALAESIV